MLVDPSETTTAPDHRRNKIFFVDDGKPFPRSYRLVSKTERVPCRCGRPSVPRARGYGGIIPGTVSQQTIPHFFVILFDHSLRVEKGAAADRIDHLVDPRALDVDPAVTVGFVIQAHDFFQSFAEGLGILVQPQVPLIADIAAGMLIPENPADIIIGGFDHPPVECGQLRDAV